MKLKFALIGALIVAVLTCYILAGILILAAAGRVSASAPPPLISVPAPYYAFAADHGTWIQVFLIVPDNTKSDDDREMFLDFKEQLGRIGRPAVVGICTQVDEDIYNCIPDYGTIYVTTKP